MFYLGFCSRAVRRILTPFRVMTLSLRSSVRKYAECSTRAPRVFKYKADIHECECKREREREEEDEEE